MAFNNRRKGDPAYTTKQWDANKQHWRTLRLPCARCNQAIDYDATYFTTVRGRRTINPRALVVGHIVGKIDARARGWTEAETNALANTQPECAECSLKSGARRGNQRQRETQRTMIKPIRDW